MSESGIHIFGIRHHGPGSARSLRHALQALGPDLILLEGPPDADAILPLAKHQEMAPPVAILVHAVDEPRRAVFYPFAVFSPEWQAIRYALERDIPLRFMDLAQCHQLAAERTSPAAPESPPATGPALRRDPLAALAQAAGYTDGERWWEGMVEQRIDGADLFAGIREAMTALREKPETPEEPEDLRREACMRQTIRTARKEGFERIAVVCGAWHTPALADMPPAKKDAETLKGLPKVKVQATWVPWTYDRLAWWSGYGAGVTSPGWYDHLWSCADGVAIQWMTKVARLLRDEDIDCSSAHIIEAVRLAETLASLRGRSRPGLVEMNEAARSVFCFDSDAPMRLIADKLIVSQRLGAVPEETPATPLAQDVQRLQKRLRLKPEASDKVLDLDLRNANDLERSCLLHRLNLLNISWGRTEGRGGAKGTFHEIWRLRWQPEFAVLVIERGIWGNTLEEAAGAFAKDAADKAEDLPTLTTLLGNVLLADLPEVVRHLMSRLESQAAVATDVSHLMDALPSLANILRYGNVRQTDATMVGHAVDGLVARICVGLPPACASLNDEAAEQMYARMMNVHAAISLLQNDPHTQDWHAVLRRLADSSSLHGLLAGRSCRLLLDTAQLDAADVARRMSLALSVASDPVQAAAWAEGFLRGSGLLLLYDESLWNVIDEWVTQLRPDIFQQVLPLLRRTFATFPAGERRQMGQRAAHGVPSSARAAAQAPTDIDMARAEQVLPLLAKLLGLDGSDIR